MSGHWPWHNLRLGMPFGADWRDFPVTLTIEAVLVRVFGLFTSSPGLVLNLIWLLGTVASAGFAAFSLQRLGVQKGVAVCLAVLYALQPFTFFRGVGHFNLLFYLVPLLALGAIEIAVGRIPGDRVKSRAFWPPRLMTAYPSIPAYLYWACLAQGLSYIYNSFFSVVLFAVAAFLAYGASRRKAVLSGGAVAIIVICCSASIGLAPSLAYWAKHGANPAMAYKWPVEAETYGLKLRHLFTPIPDNPLPPLHYIQRKLDTAGFIGENENATSRLGTIGSIGLLFLLAWTLISCLRKPSSDDQFSRVMGACAALALTCLLLATVGGFGSLFSALVSPDIRCYNRIVVFIDFFALSAVGLLLTRASLWCRRHNWPNGLLIPALAILVAFGICDQAVTADFRDYPARERQFKMDAAFVQSVESRLPEKASIFQLPDTPFPVDPDAYHMLPFDQSRAYLHSNTLRWSWGNMIGRRPAEWTHQTANLPVKDMLLRISDAGFSGIWIDRFGYAPGSSPEREIATALNSNVLQRVDGRIAFYDIRGYLKPVSSTLSDDVRRADEYQLHPVAVTFPAGFYGEESNDRATWRWSLQDSVIRLQNRLPHARNVKLKMILQTGRRASDSIVISAAGLSEKVDANINGFPVRPDDSLEGW